ncbi:hypothetical protein ACQ4PT_007663 [Festuca glaucescens]
MAEAPDSRRMAPASLARAPTNIGALPEEILLRVMSYLTTREAVHTCLVSLYWRDLWRSVPCINVSIKEFKAEDYEDVFEREVAFKRFVNHFLMLRNPVPLVEFRLTYSMGDGDRSDSDDANDWISHVLQSNARAVKVVNQHEPLEIDHAVFTSSCLKRLHISSADLFPGFFNQLETGCPALEYLFLCDCLIMDHEIFSKTLKVLILSEQVAFIDQASISAPSLIYLSIEGDIRGGRLPILKNMASLETASALISGEIKDCVADGIRQFLGGLSNVTSLDFRYWDEKLTMEKNFQWCPRFSKLVNLTLNCSCVHAEFYALIVFLQNSPNVKKLTLKLNQGYASAITGELEDRSFTCEQLQIVKIKCSERSEMLPRVTQFLHARGVRPGQMRINRRN